MAKKKTVVTITKTRHKGKQRFSVRIEGGKTDMILSQRYTRLHDAKKGALRKLHAHTIPDDPKRPGHPGSEWNYTGDYHWQTPDGRRIEFIVK